MNWPYLVQTLLGFALGFSALYWWYRWKVAEVVLEERTSTFNSILENMEHDMKEIEVMLSKDEAEQNEDIKELEIW